MDEDTKKCALVLAAALARMPAKCLASEILFDALSHIGGPHPSPRESQEWTPDAAASLLFAQLVLHEGWPVGAAKDVYHAHCAVTGAM